MSHGSFHTTSSFDHVIVDKKREFYIQMFLEIAQDYLKNIRVTLQLKSTVQLSL